MSKRLRYLLLSTLMLALTAPSMAQSPEATIYRDKNFDGPAVNYSSPNANPGLAWSVGSVRIKSGTWQLCTEANFKGTCYTIDKDNANLSGYYYGWKGPLGSIRPDPASVTAAVPEDIYECDEGTRLTVRPGNKSVSVRINNGSWVTLKSISSRTGFAYGNSKYQFKGKDDHAIWVSGSKTVENCTRVPIKR